MPIGEGWTPSQGAEGLRREGWTAFRARADGPSGVGVCAFRGLGASMSSANDAEASDGSGHGRSISAGGRGPLLSMRTAVEARSFAAAHANIACDARGARA